MKTIKSATGTREASEPVAPMATANHQKRKQRQKQTGEIFTPPGLVNEMLDKLPVENWEAAKTFCDPACGNGNMLIEVLRRKLERGHDPLQALSTIYGADCMYENILECRLRLLKIIATAGLPITAEMVVVIMNNLKETPIGEQYPRGSLDYDFSFRPTVTLKSHVVLNWMIGIHQRGWLGTVEIPTIATTTASQSTPSIKKIVGIEAPQASGLDV